jgi:hypothetical protein
MVGARDALKSGHQGRGVGLRVGTCAPINGASYRFDLVCSLNGATTIGGYGFSAFNSLVGVLDRCSVTVIMT